MTVVITVGRIRPLDMQNQGKAPNPSLSYRFLCLVTTTSYQLPPCATLARLALALGGWGACKFWPWRHFAPVLKARKGMLQQRRKKKGLFHVNLLKGFLTGWIRQDVPGVASQAVRFRLQWLCSSLIYCANIHFYLFFPSKSQARPFHGSTAENVPF